MARRSKQGDAEALRIELINLLTNFEHELMRDDLREKVISLVPAHHLLRDLGSSLISKECAATGHDRILYYFKKYPFTILDGSELLVVAGINDWPRRVRELRKEEGWMIVSGFTAKEMLKEDDFSLSGVTDENLKKHNYILVDESQDRDSAFRWKMANSIRKKKGAVIDKVLDYLVKNVGRNVTGEELRYVANDKTEWARRVRELRTQLGWQVVTKSNGRPDLPVGVYVLASEKQAPEHDRKIPDSVRREVLQRDEYKCCDCGWHHGLWNSSDPRNLEAHHVQQHMDGGENTVENLITLCNICHDKAHRPRALKSHSRLCVT